MNEDTQEAPAVEYVEKTVQLAKETTEVFDCIASVVRDIKMGKSITDITSGNLPKLMTAVQGFDKFDDEMRADHYGNTVAFGIGSIVDSLRAKAE